jgi:cytochrome c553
MQPISITVVWLQPAPIAMAQTAKACPDGGMPLINNLTSEQILSQLKAFKSGAREGTIMPQLAKGYSDEQLEIIAKQLGNK